MLSKDHNYAISEILDDKIHNTQEIITRYCRKGYGHPSLNIYRVSYLWIFPIWERVGSYYQHDHLLEVYDFSFGQFCEKQLSEHISGLSIRCVLQ